MLAIIEHATTTLFGVSLTILLFTVGVYVSIRIGFIQLTWCRRIVGYTLGRLFKPRATEKSRGRLSSLQALTTALAGTIGTGNIAGVAGAITIGGPGAVFWMWVAGFIGMGTKYAEILLAVYYREKNIRGEYIGGPMYYIKNGLSEKYHFLGKMYSLFGCFAALGIGNMTQANTVATSIATSLPFINSTILKFFISVLLTLLIGFTLLGGVNRVGRITERIVPPMAILYIVATLAIIISNIDNLMPTISLIVTAAFNPRAVLGAGAGITVTQAVRTGVARGIFSNEAGLGSAPIAHASAETDSSVEQGFFGILEVFIDTIVICSLTAISILITELPIDYGNDIGIELTVATFNEFYGGIAPIMLAVAVALFAVTSIISWSLYGVRCFEALFKNRNIKIYKLLFLSAIIPATLLNIGVVWRIAEILNGLMMVPNVIAIVLLCGKVSGLTQKYSIDKRKTK